MIVIVDYQMGNLRSVAKALEYLGAKVKITSSPNDIDSADKLVLPGVGSFGDAVQELRKAGLFESIKNYVNQNKVFLGICLGLQLLFEESSESPGEHGLSIFKGRNERFSSAGIKVPHMGWNQISVKFQHPVLKEIPDETFFYFVHSYYAVPAAKQLIAAETQYGQETFPAAVGTPTSFAVQFHPEKSQSAGLKLLKNFIEWNP